MLIKKTCSDIAL